MTKNCPTCNRDSMPKGEGSFFPFCSERCQLIDLGKWLDEEYRISDGAADGFGNPGSTGGGGGRR